VFLWRLSFGIIRGGKQTLSTSPNALKHLLVSCINRTSCTAYTLVFSASPVHGSILHIAYAPTLLDRVCWWRILLILEGPFNLSKSAANNTYIITAFDKEINAKEPLSLMVTSHSIKVTEEPRTVTSLNQYPLGTIGLRCSLIVSRQFFLNLVITLAQVPAMEPDADD
jgi:hypothetical protein